MSNDDRSMSFCPIIYPTNQISHCAVMNRWELKVGGFEVSGRNLLKDQLPFAPAPLFMLAGLKAKAQQGCDPGKSSSSAVGGEVLLTLIAWLSSSSCGFVHLVKAADGWWH